MKDLVAAFTGHLREAMEIGSNARLTKSDHPIRNVLITGLGGSGIGGSIIAQLTDKSMPVPLLVNKDYFLPAFVDRHTLVIVSSYSGNTEETLQAMDAALAKGAKITCVSSGGKIAALAKEKGLDLVSIPGGMPPRACFGYSFTQLPYILQFHGLIGDGFRQDLNDTISLLDQEEQHIQKEARSIAESLVGKLPIIYCEARYEGVAVRFRQQINENSKMLCWHNVLPEMNHNELVGWTEAHPEAVVLMFRCEDDYFRTQKRMEISRDVVRKHGAGYIEMAAKGRTQLQRSLYLLHLGDWISWYIAEIKEIDATEVRVIDFLKNELSKM
ncbi:MAG: bifunctional phosphoglucose/phosphomannose isomerase [Bacteroidia bacterium]|nr:bifunctional phosphoglucose/phosphomannose isomerase [Bacteroidia bacterium]